MKVPLNNGCFVGDHIDEYEPLCEVITDKVTAEVPSTISEQLQKF